MSKQGDVEYDPDKRANEAVATGAVYMALSMTKAVKIAWIDGSDVVVEFDFLASPYRVHIEQIVED